MQLLCFATFLGCFLTCSSLKIAHNKILRSNLILPCAAFETRQEAGWTRRNSDWDYSPVRKSGSGVGSESSSWHWFSSGTVANTNPSGNCCSKPRAKLFCLEKPKRDKFRICETTGKVSSKDAEKRRAALSTRATRVKPAAVSSWQCQHSIHRDG